MKLVTIIGNDAGIEYGLDKPAITLGRDSDVDIIIRDLQASRRHAEIRQKGGQLFITDLGSTNGTFVNGVQIQGTQALHVGDEIRIGNVALRLQEGQVAVQPRPPAPAGRGKQEWAPRVGAGGKRRGAPDAVPPRGNLKWVLVGVAAPIIVMIGCMLIWWLTRPGGGLSEAGQGVGTSTPTAQATAAPGLPGPALPAVPDIGLPTGPGKPD